MKSKLTFNPATLTFETTDEPKVFRHLRIAGLVIATVLMLCLYFWLFTEVFGWTLPKTAVLKSENARWTSRVYLVTRDINRAERVLKGIEERDDDVYRSIYGLDNVAGNNETSIRDQKRFDYLEEAGASASVRRLVFKVDDMERRTVRQSTALDEVNMVSREAGDMISAIPAVPPIMPVTGSYRLSSGYGYRSDPVYGRTAFHRGQDFASSKGTPIYATGGGVVEKVSFSSRGYGNEILINHGYGYKTLYAHLNTIEVQKGMKVERGDRIATMGNTGKSTGPHLHYEVMYKGKNVSPSKFFDMGLPLEEYEAMVKRRAEQSTLGKMSSSSELLKKR